MLGRIGCQSICEERLLRLPKMLWSRSGVGKTEEDEDEKEDKFVNQSQQSHRWLCRAHKRKRRVNGRCRRSCLRVSSLMKFRGDGAERVWTSFYPLWRIRDTVSKKKVGTCKIIKVVSDVLHCTQAKTHSQASIKRIRIKHFPPTA